MIFLLRDIFYFFFKWMGVFMFFILSCFCFLRGHDSYFSLTCVKRMTHFWLCCLMICFLFVVKGLKPLTLTTMGWPLRNHLITLFLLVLISLVNVFLHPPFKYSNVWWFVSLWSRVWSLIIETQQQQPDLINHLVTLF